MKRKKIEIGLDRGCVIVRIPIELITVILQPRIQFAALQDFTRREQEVLDGICESLSNKEIGSRINAAERTVKFHVTSLLAKVGVRSRRDLQMQFAGIAMHRKRK
jgi:two-component system nitrate/nitrite response regulator NarL